MTAAIVTLGLVVALLTVLVLGLLRSHGEILRALHDLGVDLDPGSTGAGAALVPRPVPGPLGSGATVPTSIVGLDTSGGSISVALVGDRRLTLLAFLSSGCLTCLPMWEALASGEAEIPGGARPVAVTKGPHEESPASVRALSSRLLATVMSSETWAEFKVPGSPYFVLVDGSGSIIGEGTAGTWSRVLELLGEALADGGHPPSREQPVVGRPRGTGRERLQHVEATLRAAGVEAGHPSLHADP